MRKHETFRQKSKNASKCTKRWSDHEVEQPIDLLEENSCLWNVSNKDYYLRKKHERAYKQIEGKLGTERAVIKAKITSLRQQRWQLLRSFACTTQQVSTTPNVVGPPKGCDLLRPVAWALIVVGSAATFLYTKCYSTNGKYMYVLVVAIIKQKYLAILKSMLAMKLFNKYCVLYHRL